MKIIICDDDSNTTSLLHSYIESFFMKNSLTDYEIAVYSCGDAILKNNDYADIALLDVELPGTSGINVGTFLKEKNPRIKIFIITSFDEYLDEAMQCQVYRYLTKPVDKNRLYRNLKSAIRQYYEEAREIIIDSEGNLLACNAEQIICAESEGRKTRIYTTFRTLLNSQGIEEWKEKLSMPCFYSTHRKCIVNLKYIYEIKKDEVILKTGDQQLKMYLARRKFTECRERYLLYLENMK